MVVARRGVLARVAYGAAFVAGVPLLLFWWAHTTAASVTLPAVHAPIAGNLLAVAGIAIMAGGMIALAHRGGGLPMNAFPPPRLVTSGIYRWLAHPIYVGFVALVFGVSLATGSASGLWLVAPVTALGAAALVLGYEAHDLRRRFGTPYRPLLSLPRAEGGAPTAADRSAVFVLVLLPWLLLYEAVHWLGIPPDAIDSRLPLERGWPVLQWTEAIYVTAYIVIPAAVLLAPSRAALRRFALHGLIATAVVTLIYITVPLISPPRPFEPASPLGRLLALEQRLSSTVAAFPAFHVIWACIAADTLRRRGTWWARVSLAWLILLAGSCIATGMHSSADVAAAFVFFALLVRRRLIWRALLAAAERVANSWHEWRYGAVRIINHGFYAGAGAALGVWLAAITTGEIAAVFAIALAALVGAGAWAQWLEGSPALLRPFGYYGGIAGGVLGGLALSFFGAPVLLLLGGFALGAPLVQALGRLRCLVQGCCHGAPAAAQHGICYHHPRSRVTQISQLRGVPLYPTPLYSILANLVTALLLVRLYLVGAGVALVLGLYFVLNGVARFVEESYRGEPQTPLVAGLRIYQWLAVLSVLGGIVVTTLASRAWPAPLPLHDPRAVAAALLFGAVVTFALGIDFPRSTRRFSRLAAVDDDAAPAPLLDRLQVADDLRAVPFQEGRQHDLLA